MPALPPVRIRLAVFAALPLLFPGAAFAAAATASQNVNVRSGPATSYGVVAQLQQGEAVDVRQCEGAFCQVSFGGKSGWVSANFLTRDYVARAPATTVLATTAPATTSSNLPPLTPAAKPTSPQIASTTPKATPGMPLPPGAFPPAYDDNAGAAAGSDDSGPDYANDNGDGYTPGNDDNGPGYASGDDGSANSSVTLPDDSGDVIASTGNPPRPQVDVPNAARSGPDDEFADNGDDSGYSANAPDDNSDFTGPAPSDQDRFGDGPGWRSRFGRYGGWHGRFAGAPGGQACFFSASGFGGDGFCLHAGQSVAALGEWSDRIFAVRNPRGLNVTVCSAPGYRDCRVYRTSGPLLLPANAGVASISVAAPGY